MDEHLILPPLATEATATLFLLLFAAIVAMIVEHCVAAENWSMIAQLAHIEEHDAVGHSGHVAWEKHLPNVFAVVQSQAFWQQQV